MVDGYSYKSVQNPTSLTIISFRIQPKDGCFGQSENGWGWERERRRWGSTRMNYLRLLNI